MQYHVIHPWQSYQKPLLLTQIPLLEYPQDFFPMLDIPNIYEALRLGPNNSTEPYGSCPFTYERWVLAPTI